MNHLEKLQFLVSFTKTFVVELLCSHSNYIVECDYYDDID